MSSLSHSMVPLLAWRTLTHDKVRFFVTLVGVIFSVVLVGMQSGLLVNFIRTTSLIASESNADIFIAAPGVRSAEISTPQREHRRFQALGVDGVASAENYSIDFALWKRPDGVREAVMLVGIEPSAKLGLPWNIEGDGQAGTLLRLPDGVLIDRLYAQKLGATHVGQLFEVNDIRTRIVGFTQGIRTFTQAPYVFTSLENARRITGFGPKHISYVLVSVQPGADAQQVANALAKRLPDTSVMTRQEFAHKSASYWLLTTGAGAALIMSALLGLCVGGVIVTQTLYANTIDLLPEYATLRAMGGSLSYLRRVVMGQAMFAAFFGYTIGISIVAGIVWSTRNASAAPELPLWLAAGIAVNTLLVCLASAFVSVRKLQSVDPVTVFR